MFEKKSFKRKGALSVDWLSSQLYGLLEKEISQKLGENEIAFVSKIEFNVYNEKDYLKDQRDYYDSKEFKEKRNKALKEERKGMGLNV